ncbi:MAG: cyclic nucleotide-binding domain-containing protein, partial [Spirochaetaceae bacterium]|nr:cyclic nucleotide-binding domain-containing protein [Spirochaetaceae bacterium]
KIIKQNIQFLFNRNVLIDLKVQESGIFICDNDSFDIIVYTNLLTTYLAETGRIGFDTKFQLQTALMEMLLNALEHGNCNINYDEKTQWLESGRDILELISERNKDPAIAAKKIILSYDIDVNETHFSIKDEGDGFDWQDMLQRDIEPNLHGMGIKMTESMVKSLAYNEKGNEVFFSIINEPGSVNPERIPFKIKWYKDRCVIKKASEPSDSIYFLLTGSISVTHYRQVVGHYVPADILIGYSNPFSSKPFSGTMKAVDEAKIIKISKQDFEKFLEQYPSFKVFTERLKTRTYSAANPV